MKVYYHTQTYCPSDDLKFRLRKLAEIAAFAKMLDLTDLFNQARNQHDSLARQYNAVAETKKKGFWGQFLDNLSNTTTNVVMEKDLVSCYDFTSTYSLYKNSDVKIKTLLLENALKELQAGTDIQRRLGF